jgi:flavin reductase (DIM6/NTAB) family NADH-FMN oxidoreductase RutF
MELKNIPIESFMVKPVNLWMNQWLILTSGNYSEGKFNSMTVAWGSIGNMWSKPFAQVVVRPSRYTYNFIEEYDSFTLCVFEKKYRDALNLIGTKSGRDGNKIEEAGLTPVASGQIGTPSFSEAELVLECRKMYQDDMDPAHFLQSDIENNYGGSNYHRIYFGEIIAISGIDKYCA